MRMLETKVPPPVVTLIVAGLMWAAARMTPSLSLTLGAAAWLGSAIALLGLVLEVVAAVTFRRACTTVNPLRPSDATALVVNGVFRYSRNPIYVGDLLVLIGWGIYLGNPVALALTPLFVIYINRYQIEPEERVLSEKFREPYREYRSRVRRWI